MLNTAEIELMLIEGVLEHARLGTAVELLLDRLLSDLSGYAGRPTDGVIFEHTRMTGRQAIASGVVVMLDGTVEPVRVELVVSEAGDVLSSGNICFGDATRTVRYGSRAARRLRDAMCACPTADYAWKETFYRADDGWHRDAPAFW
jgi:hypothetical protein